MTRKVHSPSLAMVSLLLLGSLQISWAADQQATFSRDISPVLSKKCFQCHGPDQEHRKGDLRLDQPDAEDGPFTNHDGYQSLLPGNLEKSELWYRITADDEDDVMPPPDSNLEALTEEEKAAFKQWILNGAKYEKFWAFDTPKTKEAPNIRSANWGRNAIDRFILKRLEEGGLEPSKRAFKRTLIRRVTLDLTGLPPTPEDIHTFLNDQSDTAYADLVDRLLGSPRYGEHMAKYWLDLVRFADTNGLHHDHYREVTPYRDWVIRSFNDNLSYDDFVRYQLAGDLYDSPTQDQLIASGFNRLHLIIDVGTALPEESFTRNVVDRVTAFGTAFMGLTLQCAGCHDHKYDPVTTKDFYQLFAFFNNFDGKPETGGRSGLDFKRGLQKPYIEMPSPHQKNQLYALNKEIKKLEPILKELSPEKGEEDSLNEEDKALQASLKKDLEQLKKARDEVQMAVPAALVMKERQEPLQAHILKRGVYDQPGEPVQRNTPGFLPPLQSTGDIKSRMDLANWVVAPYNPLTARVAVNRFWQQCFGTGLVKTSADFGAQGDRPSHPELLDYLSLQFMESGWDIKQLMRTIVMSESYQQSSKINPESRVNDPENRLLARGSRFRMDSEMVRDQVLMAGGLLNHDMLGKSVKPPQPAKLWQIVAMPSSYPRIFRADDGKKAFRRSVYTFWKRGLPPPQMTIFDAPTREACIARRERTNTPLQALMLMNEPQFFSAAAHCAQGILENTDWKDAQRIERAYETITSHLPTDTEARALKQALESFREHYNKNVDAAQALTSGYLSGNTSNDDSIELASWTMLTHALLNLDIVKTRQ